MGMIGIERHERRPCGIEKFEHDGGPSTALTVLWFTLVVSPLRFTQALRRLAEKLEGRSR